MLLKIRQGMERMQKAAGEEAPDSLRELEARAGTRGNSG